MNYFSLIVLLLLACSGNEDELIKQNSNPDSIRIESISFDGKKVTIDWNDVDDNDGDVIYYKLFIDSELIGEERIQSNGFVVLEYNNSYTGKIFATDKKGGVSEIEFQFETLKSKILFFTDFSGVLTAFDLITNEVLWESQSNSIEAHTAITNVVFEGVDGIIGLDLLSGETIWKSEPSNSNSQYYRNIITDGEYVFAFGYGSDLHCVNFASKEKLWELSFLDYYAQLSIDDSKVYVCSRNNDQLFAINKISGNLEWGFSVDYSTSGAARKINTNPLIIDNDLFFGDNLGRFYSLNKETGNKNWSKIATEPAYSFFASPTLYENSIIIGTYRTLFAFDKEDGSILWSYSPTANTIESSPFVYNGNVYFGISSFGGGSGSLVCLNAETGIEKWRYNLEGGRVTCSPIVYEDKVYIGNWSSDFYVINASTGSLEMKIKTNNIITKSPIIVIGNSESIIYPSVHGLKD